MLALAMGMLAAPGAGAERGDAGATAAVLSAGGSGARSAATTNVLTLNAPDVNNRISAFTDFSTGRLVLTSPEGFNNPPPTPDMQCVQDSPTQISCEPGYIGVILGDLGGGDDTFAATGVIGVRIGDLSGGQRRPLSGGLGRDRIVGGSSADVIDGGTGDDSLVGAGDEDRASGGSGKDKLKGGGAQDALYGGGGPDKLDGGPRKDGCVGGGGRDSAKNCEFLKSVP
jgi:hypothetical protein